MNHSVKLQSVDSIPKSPLNIHTLIPHHRGGVLHWKESKCDSSFPENWGDPVFMATKTLWLEAGDLAAHSAENLRAFPEEEGRGWWEKWEPGQQYLHSLIGGREVFIEPHVLYGHLWEVRGAGGHTQQGLTDPQRIPLKTDNVCWPWGRPVVF